MHNVPLAGDNGFSAHSTTVKALGILSGLYFAALGIHSSGSATKIQGVLQFYHEQHGYINDALLQSVLFQQPKRASQKFRSALYQRPERNQSMADGSFVHVWLHSWV